MEQSSTDRRTATTWDCSVCGRSRLCPYSAPCSTGDASTEACRTCGDALATQTPRNTAALRAAIGHHLI